MTATWCLIDGSGESTTDIGPSTRLAGLSLLARHARMAARQEWAGVVIRLDSAEMRTECERALAIEPPPSGFVVEYTYTDNEPHPDEGRAFVQLSLRAVYHADALREAAMTATPTSTVAPSPMVAIQTRTHLRAAEKALYMAIRKNIDQDGVLAYHVFRMISRAITRLFVDTPVTPNHVSLSAMMFGIVAAICAMLGTVTGFVWAGVLYWFGSVVDCVDGEIARLRLQGSKLGEWLDSMADEVSTYGLLTGLGVGLMRQESDNGWIAFAFVGAIVGVLVHVKLYWDLHRWGAPIDTAQYPWFFGTPADSTERISASAQVIRLLGFCFRRDVFVTAVAVLLAMNEPRGAVLLLSGGVAIVVALLVTHLFVMTVRASSPKR